MAIVFIIWSRKEKCIVPDPYANFPSSQAATEHIRRLVSKAGDQKDQQAKTYDVISVTV